MCGICGVVRFAGRPIAGDALNRACRALRHRGPDHTGTWVAAGSPVYVALGATRLAVMDPSPRAHQPLQDSSGRWHIVFNGEVYNFGSIRRELRHAGEEFQTAGDTEVVGAACARWGIDALARFNGMFALAFYDAQTCRGFLARDRFGIKPLFYTAGPAALAFASELGALCELGELDKSVDPQAVAEHLLFGYISQPNTIYQGARRLEPGHYISFDASRAGAPMCFGKQLGTTPDESPSDYGSALGRVRRALADAVTSRRLSDAPIGAFLSGGLDSSIVALHLAESTGRPIKTFAVGYRGKTEYNETRYARLVADRLGTDHHEVVLGERDVLAALPLILDHLSEPVGDSSIVPTALLAGFARRFVTVALSGDGGDELFGGYWRYLGHTALDVYRRIPGMLRTLLVEPLLSAAASSKASALGNRVRQFRKLLRTRAADPLQRHVMWSRILAPEAEGVFAERPHMEGCLARTLRIARSEYDGTDGDDPLNRILRFDRRHQLPADMLQKVDLASMCHSLEVRVPFLDGRVVDLAESLPAPFKISRGLRKRVLVDAYRGRLPDAVLDRPKQGFEVPIGEFLRGPLRDMFFDTVSRKVVESFGLLSYDGIERVYADHLERRGEHADALFAVLSLCWWRSRHA